MNIKFKTTIKAPCVVLAITFALASPKAFCQHDALADWLDQEAKAENLLDSGNYRQAQKNFADALELVKKSEPNSIHNAESLYGLSTALYNLGSYKDAESLAEQSLEIGEKLLPSDSHELAEEVNNLADIYQAQNKFADAAPLYQRALAIIEKRTGKDDQLYRRVLISSGANLLFSGKYSDAEPVLKSALDLCEKAHDEFNQALALGNLSSLYSAQNHLDQAHDAAEQALSVATKTSGGYQAKLIPFINELANVNAQQGNKAEAQKLLDRVNKIEAAAGVTHAPKANAHDLNIGRQKPYHPEAYEAPSAAGKPVN